MQIEIGSQAVIYDADPELVQLIRRTVAAEDIPLLRITNPEYINVVKYGNKFGDKPPRWWNGYEFYKGPNTYIVPRAWMELVIDALDLQCDIEYMTVDVPAKYPKPALKPLSHQELALNSFYALVNNNDKYERPTDSCVVLNTSAGKTILGMLAAYHSDQRALVVVPTREIEESWLADACKLFNCNRKDIGQIRGKTLRIGDYLTVGSVQTLMNLEPHLWCREFGMLILDELHQMAAKCFSKVLQHSMATLRLGLTATDSRKDGLMPVVRWYLGDNCYKDMTPMNCVDLTYMGIMFKEPLPEVQPKKILDVKKMKSRKASYEKKYIDRELLKRQMSSKDPIAMKLIKKDFKEFYAKLNLPDLYRKSKESTYQELVRSLTEFDNYNDFIVDLCVYIMDNYDGDILISSSVIEHIELLVERLTNELGVPVAKLIGSSAKGREKIYDDIKAGKYKITVGTQKIVSTGASNPRWVHVIIATPFSSPELAIQLKGRPIRLDDNDKSKTMGYVWDIIATDNGMAKNMGRTRFKAIEPYKQFHEWVDATKIQGAISVS